MSVKQPLTVRIAIKNKAGEIVGDREVVSYAGLLAKAHDEGLEGIETVIVQVPTEANGNVAIVRAIVRGRFGTFTGIGDADPTSVNRAVARHLLRMAETRAKARALRDAINVGMVSLDELGGDEAEVIGDATPARTAPVAPSGAMSEAQKRILLRQAAQLGHEDDAAQRFISGRVGIRDGRAPTKREASKLIDELDAELRRAGPRAVKGGGHRAA